MKKVGELVVFRKDVCKIIEVSENAFNHVMSYTLIPITDESLKMNVPVNNENIRELMSKEEALSLMKNIESIPIINVEDKLIEAEYKRLLKEEKNDGLLQIIKTTYLRNQKRISANKKVSDKDKTYFELAEKYLFTELATVLDLTVDEAKNMILEKLKEF